MHRSYGFDLSRNIIKSNVDNDLRFNIPNIQSEKVKNCTDNFLLTDDTIHKIISVFKEEMELGLLPNPPRKSSLQMANTFIPKHLSGYERGEFLALDLGGTNFRVILLTLDLNRELQSIVKYYKVPEELRLGEGKKLFDFLADCIYHFLEENELFGFKIPLGFCFSFPMIQTSINEGILVTWTKTFKTTNVEGQEVVKMLRTALQKYKKIDVDIVAIINDATGTMMMGSYLDKRSAIGLILGTGCNASYFEKVEKIKKWQGDHYGIEEVIIDIEWGAFGDNGVLDFIKTEFDRSVDEGSLLVKSFTFEKLLAGRYIGELAKQVILALIGVDALFSETTLKAEEWTLTAADVSEILQEPSSLELIQKLLKKKGFTNAGILDSEIVHYVCIVISIRGALLVSICLATLLKRMDKDDVTIAVDGSLFKLHPKYKTYMERFIAVLAPNHKFRLILAEDGSGKGAGLVAAVVTTLENKAALRG